MYVCTCVLFVLWVSLLILSRIRSQDVYIAALAPLQLPARARTLVIEVLTSSGPAPDALVVPLVDESYQATRQ